MNQNNNEPVKAKRNQQKQLAEKRRKLKKNQTMMSFNIPKDLKRKLKIYAAQHDMDMTDLLIEKIEIMTRGID